MLSGGLYWNSSSSILCRMKAFVISAFAFVFLCCGISRVDAQNYLYQSFDSTAFPPTGWSDVFVKGYLASSSDSVWYRQVSYGIMHPSITTHSGRGMASYNSWTTYAGSEAILITPSIDLTSYVGGTDKITFWFYKSADAVSGFGGYESDTLNLWIGKSASLLGAAKLGMLINGIKNVPVETVAGWYKYTVDIPDSFSTSSHTYIIFDAVSAYEDDLFIDDISVDHIPACSGTPSVSLLPVATNMHSCIAGIFTLTGSSNSNYVGQDFQWQKATTASGPWTNITGATDTTYRDSTIAAGVVYYRLKDSCVGSGGVGYSMPDTITTSIPPYAALPYFQDFENWQDDCGSFDKPGLNWLAIPHSGNGSWRRDDQGCTWGGWATSACEYYPVNSLGGNNYISGTHCARFHSSGELFSSATPWKGSLNLYVNCSGVGNKLLQFYFKNQPSYNTPYIGYNNDSLSVLMSTDGGLTFTELWGADTTQEWKKIQVQIPSTTATTVIRFLAKRNGGNPIGVGETVDLSDIGLDSVYIANPCTGLASGGFVSPSGNISICSGGDQLLTVGGIPPEGGIEYQWQKSTTPFKAFNNITGATDIRYNTPALFDTVQYRVAVTCPYASPAITLFGAVTTLAVKPVPPASLNLATPGVEYHYSFESWGNRCATDDAPLSYAGSSISNWANYPATGTNSWRRDDEGASAGWDYPNTTTPYVYTPLAYDSNFSAHFYTYDHWGTRRPGNLYLFVDCSSDTADKELDYYINVDSMQRGFVSDTMACWLSTDGGNTFSLLRKDYNGNNSWKLVKLDLPSKSAKTIIRFQGIYGDPNYSVNSGIGLDNVNILRSCTGKPAAGVLTGDTLCRNDSVSLKISGSSIAKGLYYQWQRSTDGKTWSNIKSDSSIEIKTGFTVNTYLRAIAVCTKSGLTDTTNVAAFILKPFYQCYCNPVTAVTFQNIDGALGDVLIRTAMNDTVMNNIEGNGNITYNSWAIKLQSGALMALNGYTNFRDTVPPVTLTIDSSYIMSITQVSPNAAFYGGYPINVYIDYNHDGIFGNSLSGERVFNKAAALWYAPTAIDTMRIPDTATIGLTGMRILVGVFEVNPLVPCGPGNANYGEIRDYLVNIVYPPCDGLPYAGDIKSSAYSVCAGQSIKLTDTTHDNRRSRLSWNWESSHDGSSWTDISGTANQDTLTQTINDSTWYRLRMVCNTYHDTSVSKSVFIKLNPRYTCYCISQSNGGPDYDSSDIGMFSFGGVLINKKGSFLSNATAHYAYTSYIGDLLELDIDSTYPLILSHILSSATGSRSKISMFIDYNNNYKYDLPDERVWAIIAPAGTWYFTTAIKIPATAVTNVITGMRVILNDDINPNAASDDGCGEYTSGQTMDFAVRFNQPWPTTIGNIEKLQNLQMYPNPTDGAFNISFSSAGVIKDMQISISNMAGQQVYTKSYPNTQGQFNTEINLGQIARGVYFITFIADGERMIKKMVIK